MKLESEENNEWSKRKEALSKERLHRFAPYWRENLDNSVHQERHSMVQMILVEKREKTLRMWRQESIKDLNRSLRLSNRVGRVHSEIND